MTASRTPKKNPSANTLYHRRKRLAARWDKIAKSADEIEWGETGIATLAEKVGFKWFASRGDEPIMDFLALDGQDLLEVHGFGVYKFERLCDIMEAAIADDASDLVGNLLTTADPYETLAEWNVPADFPVELIILPARVINFCNANGLETLDRFMDRWAELGAYGFLREKNMGKGSVEVIGTLMDSIWSADRETASEFLPLHPSEPGMTLGQSLKLLVRNMPLGVPAFLQRRLVQGLTLADSAEAAGLTRERIRQMEQVLLSDVSARLDYFPKERAKVLDALTEGRDLSELLLEGGNSPDDDLIVAAVEALFRNLPRNAAAGVPFDELGEAWLDTLTHHPQLWFGGVPLDGFLTEHVPPQHQDRFREYVADQERFRLDRVDRRVHPAQIGLRATAEALLALQPRPIPLTKLVELLERTGFHRGITREMLLQRRRQWRRALALQKKKILWNE